MKKTYLKYLAVALIASAFIGCKENYNGLDANHTPTNVIKVEYTMVPADYSTIATLTRNTPDSTAGKQAGKDKAFSAAAPSSVLVPYLLNSMYYAADNASSALVTYSYNASPYLSEDFETQTANAPVTVAGWINKNTVGNLTWTAKAYNGNAYAQFSSNKSGEVNEAYLITNELDLTQSNAPALTFDAAVGYYNTDCLQVLISSNFDGNAADIASAQWDDVTSNFTFPKQASGYSKMAPAGSADLSAYAGKKIYIAFKYSGDDTSTPKKTTTYQIDNVLVAQPTSMETSQFVFSSKLQSWTFDPTIYDVMTKPDYQIIVDYFIATPIAQANPDLYDNVHNNAEYYYGSNSYYKEIDYGSNRSKDPDYAAITDTQSQIDFLDQRTQDALAIYLSIKYPNAQATVSGLQQSAYVTTYIYNDLHADGSRSNTNYVYKYDCTGDKTWTFVERTAK